MNWKTKRRGCISDPTDRKGVIVGGYSSLMSFICFSASPHFVQPGSHVPVHSTTRMIPLQCTWAVCLSCVTLQWTPRLARLSRQLPSAQRTHSSEQCCSPNMQSCFVPPSLCPCSSPCLAFSSLKAYSDVISFVNLFPPCVRRSQEAVDGVRVSFICIRMNIPDV